MAITQEDWLQAQCSVLGSVLIEPSLVPKVIAETSSSDYTGPCQSIYNTIRKLFLSGSTVDVVSIAAAMGKDYRDYLMQLMEVTPTAANLDHYIQLCREQARILSVRNIGYQLAEADSSDTIRNLLEDANSLMVDKPSLKIVSMGDALKSFMTRHTGETHYLSWPVRDLDDRIYAELGDFIIIGGYPSTGKSAWVIQCGTHWAKKYRVGFFSLETSSEKLFDRQISSMAKISMDEIKRNAITTEGWEKVCAMSTEITSLNIELIPAAGMTPADIRAITMMRGYQIVIIDYLQLLQSSGGNRTEQVTAISIALHTLAQSLGVTVVALSQLARQTQQGSSSGKAILRESGQIDQDADIIMILSLEEKDNPAGNRVMSIDKNKEGTCPNILLAFDGKHQTFTKAQRTNEVVGQLSASAKRQRQKNRSALDSAQMAQQSFAEITGDDPDLPFKEV